MRRGIVVAQTTSQNYPGWLVPRWGAVSALFAAYWPGLGENIVNVFVACVELPFGGLGVGRGEVKTLVSRRSVPRAAPNGLFPESPPPLPRPERARSGRLWHPLADVATRTSSLAPTPADSPPTHRRLTADSPPVLGSPLQYPRPMATQNGAAGTSSQVVNSKNPDGQDIFSIVRRRPVYPRTLCSLDRPHHAHTRPHHPFFARTR